MSPRPALGSVRKPQILSAALDALYEQGVEATRISDIAERVGLHASTVLHYFPSREQLIGEALDFSDHDYYARLYAQVAAQGTPADQLAWLVHRFSHTPEPLDDWTLLMEVWIAALRQPEMRAVHQRVQRRLREVTARIVERGVAEGQFAAVEVDDTALVLTGLMDGLGVQRTLEDPEVGAERMERLILGLASTLLAYDFEPPSRPAEVVQA